MPSQPNKRDSTRIVLSRKRKERGSLRKVAIDFGITELHLRNIINGRGDPGVRLMFKMGRYFGESVYILFPDLADQD